MEEYNVKKINKKNKRKIVILVIIIILVVLSVKNFYNKHPYKFEGEQYMEGDDVVIELRGEKYYYIEEDLLENHSTDDQICELKSSTVNDLGILELLITSFPIYKIKGDKEGDFIKFSGMIGKYRGIYAKKEALKKMENWRKGEVTGLRIKCYNGRMEIAEDSDAVEFFKKLNNYKGKEIKIPKDYDNQDFVWISFYYNKLPFYEKKYELIKYNEKYYYFIAFDSSEGREEGKVKQVCTEITEPEIIQVIKGLFQGEYDEYQFKRPE